MTPRNKRTGSPYQKSLSAAYWQERYELVLKALYYAAEDLKASGAKCSYLPQNQVSEWISRAEGIDPG